MLRLRLRLRLRLGPGLGLGLRQSECRHQVLRWYLDVVIFLSARLVNVAEQFHIRSREIALKQVENTRYLNSRECVILRYHGPTNFDGNVETVHQGVRRTIVKELNLYVRQGDLEAVVKILLQKHLSGGKLGSPSRRHTPRGVIVPGKLAPSLAEVSPPEIGVTGEIRVGPESTGLRWWKGGGGVARKPAGSRIRETRESWG